MSGPPDGATTKDLLRIHVVWAHGSAEGNRIAELVSRHFDGIGMERDGVACRVPVRFHSVPWADGSPLPRPIELGRSVHNAVALLRDEAMEDDRSAWDGWVRDLRAATADRGDADLYVPFGSPTGEPPLPSDLAARVHEVRRAAWTRLPTRESRDARLLLHLLHATRCRLASALGRSHREVLFVSHAKADGDASARAIVDFVNDSGNDVPLDTFYDAMELNPGENFGLRFESEIAHATLIALVSDIYDSRPWCIAELTAAKRARRPIVLADLGGRRISRTYPYGANLPRVRVDPTGVTEWIEPLLVEALSEGLRCDVFAAQALRVLGAGGHVLALPRPPELFDIVDAPSVPATIVYPDPPLGDVEADLLARALAAIAPGTRLATLGELS